MQTQIQFLRDAPMGGIGLAPTPQLFAHAHTAGVGVNDIHSQLNATHVDRVVEVSSEAALRGALAAARAAGKSVCVAGGRHAMGGQQFAAGAVLLDMRPMNRIVSLDRCARHRRSRGRHPVAGADPWPDRHAAGLRAGLEHRPEADRRRPPHARRRARQQHPRPRAHAAADHRRRGVVHPDGRRRPAAHLQPQRERRSLSSRDRRLRPVRRGHPRAAAADAAGQARARGAAHRRGRADAGLRAAHRRRIPLRRLPVLDRHVLRHLSAQGRVLVLSPAAARHADAGGAEGAGRGALARALLSARTRTRGAPTRPTPPTICPPPASATGPTPVSSASTSTTITPSSTGGSVPPTRAPR